MIDIFISYSHEDSEFAQDIREELDSTGLQCFMAEININPGALWEYEIRKAIIDAKRVLLLITPNSKNSLWIAAEAGAAWALEKELIAGLRYVDPSELIDVIRKHQVHKLESKTNIKKLVEWLAPDPLPPGTNISGQWLDPIDGDTSYFKQKGNRVVGVYDYGRNSITGIYKGTIDNSIFSYSWHWIAKEFSGEGRMEISSDGNNISGKWWFSDNPEESGKVQYKRVSDDLPKWLDVGQFEKHLEYLNGEGW